MCYYFSATHLLSGEYQQQHNFDANSKWRQTTQSVNSIRTTQFQLTWQINFRIAFLADR